MVTDRDLKNNLYWKDKLDAETYKITREKGTEAPFSGALLDVSDEGIYTCVCCQQELFISTHKFDAGCGWPSYDAAKTEDAILYRDDESLGRRRVEILCSKCDSHLGHIFDDGPTATGKRFCVNSKSLQFKKQSLVD